MASVLQEYDYPVVARRVKSIWSDFWGAITSSL